MLAALENNRYNEKHHSTQGFRCPFPPQKYLDDARRWGALFYSHNANRVQNIAVSAFLRDGDGASIMAADLPAEARLN